MLSISWYGLTDLEINVEIGRRLKWLRIENHLTQQMLADRTGLNRSTIRDIENGKPVNLMSLLPVFRELDLLEKLNGCLPNTADNPVLAHDVRNRQRVRLSAKERKQ